jgi:hypothetical protein
VKNEKTDIEKPDVEHDVPTTTAPESFITTDFVERFEEAARVYQSRYLPACLRLTQPSDWVKMGTRFFLQSTGAEKIAVPLGIEWTDVEVIKHERGSYYEYEVRGIMRSKLLKREIWCTGNCDSRDQFLTAQSSFDEGTIRKAAMSNFITNGVSRIAGIRNPDLAMLQRAGINPGAVGNVDYSGNKSSEEGKQVISDAQGKRLYAISRGRNMTDEDVKKVIAREPWKYGSTKDITRGHYEAICKAVETWEPEREPGSDG